MLEGRINFTAGVCILCVVSLGVGLAPLISPNWGKFINQRALNQGHFGPWQVCITRTPAESLCGPHHTRFRPEVWTLLAGISAALGEALMSIVCVTLALTLSMMKTKLRVFCNFKSAIWTQATTSSFASFCAILSGIFFSLQGDMRSLGYNVLRGWAFYIQLVVIILDFVVALGCGIILHWGRSLGGDPTLYSRDPEGDHVHTITNPNFKESKSSVPNGHSAAPLPSPQPIILANGHPLKSSLKKKKAAPVENGDLTMANPGFNPNSPSFNRTGSIKKVRIQTQSTDV